MDNKSGHVQDEMKLVGEYRSGFTGAVPKEFTLPGKFAITPMYKNGEGMAREAYGYAAQESHPTPTAPGKGTI